MQKVLQDYKNLQDIIAILGMDELSEASGGWGWVAGLAPWARVMAPSPRGRGAERAPVASPRRVGPCP